MILTIWNNALKLVVNIMNIEIINSFIAEVKEINWFSNVGKEQFFSMKLKANFIGDFKKFSSSINSLDWENTTLEASNNLLEFLQIKNVKESNNWNKTVQQIKEKIDFVNNLSSTFFNQYELDIKSDLEWNVVMIILEKYYKSINSKIPVFFDDLYSIYKKGNIPCGFEFVDDWNFIL